MKKMMLIGESRVGKTTIINTIHGENFNSRITMAVEFCGQFIDTPGEFLENRRFYPALITSSADADIVAMVQDATRNSSLFPPKFTSIFERKVIGIVSKIDADDINIKRAERFLNNAGAKEIIHVSSYENIGLDLIKEMIGM